MSFRRATILAVETHARQRDKRGEPYLLHVFRVSQAVAPRSETVAVLHDVVEDGDKTLQEVVDRCLLSKTEADALDALTRRPKEPYGSSYILRIIKTQGEAGEIAREVKLADLADNLKRIPSGSDVIFLRDWEPLKKCYESAKKALEAA